MKDITRSNGKEKENTIQLGKWRCYSVYAVNNLFVNFPAHSLGNVQRYE